MEIACQRCNETLREVDRYCPVCGLPQLIYIADEVPSIAAVAQGAPSGLSQFGGLGNGIDWRPALKAIITVGIPAGFLCAWFSSMGLFWIVASAAWAVTLYARRLRTGWVSSGVGARIGLVTGLLAGWLAFSFDGVLSWVQRFPMHQGGQIDSSHLADVETNLRLGQQMWASMGMGSAQVAQTSALYRSWMLSPEGYAGIVLAQLLVTTMFLILFAVLGGAVGARFLGQRRRPSA